MDCPQDIKDKEKEFFARREHKYKSGSDPAPLETPPPSLEMIES